MARYLSKEELEKIFEYSNKSFCKEIKRCEAIEYLKENITTHSEDSLAMYVDNYRYLRSGVPYGRNMSSQILEFFLEKIYSIYGIDSLYIAMFSLYYHILKYYNQTGQRQNSDLEIGKKIAEKYDIPIAFSNDMFFINELNETRYDKEYINEVNININNVDDVKHYEKRPKPKKIVSTNVYSRDIKVALRSLANADYKCEIDKNHTTFLRKTNNKDYTEPHHLIPLCNQDMFINSLDVENNIVSLCSNCHNKLHYGRDIVDDLKFLYDKRKDLLKLAGIDITFEKLLEMYTK